MVKPAAARIGNTKYLTLSKALQAATGIEENEITIDLLIDAQETGLSYRLISGHMLIIKLNGHSDPNINVTPASGSPDGSGVEKNTADGVISYVVKIKYTVIYDLSGAPADSKIQYKYPDLFEGTKTPAIENPKWDAHVFKGWTPAVASEVKGEMADSKRNITYKANWKDDKNKNGVADDEELFTIIYKDGDSQFKKVEKQHVGDAVEQYKPEKKLYLVDKWSPDWKNKIDAAQADKDSKITYTASWKEDKNSNGKSDNEEYRTIRYTDGVLGIKVFEDKVFDKQLDGLPTPKFGDDPVRENYEFTGWLPDVPEQVNGSRTYTATWKYVGGDAEPSDKPEPAEEEFTVIYQLHGGKTVSEQTTFTGLKIGDKTPRIEDPERNGYEFTGWSPAVAEEVTGNATYSANWELIVTPDDNPEPPTVQVNWTIIAIVIVAAIAALLAILGLRKRKA
ncbi:MAG: InlB B-repeat-containing protein [Erysipelotrichaceae bacterium]|nr:InlB B-repeat-containing protein [Erysipelotrichaceae bacterium]